MATYEHRVSGFFVKREEAAIARDELLRRGLPPSQLALCANSDAALQAPPAANSNQTLKSILVDSAVGTVVGTTLGALGEVALVAANVTLFVASPLIAPLSMLGWGASLGATVGAVVGSTQLSKEGGKLSELVGDAVQHGQVVLVARTCSEAETRTAIEVIQNAVGSYEDLGRA